MTESGMARDVFRVVAIGVVGLVLGVPAVADAAHRWAAGRGYGKASPSATEALIVLGCPSREDGSLHPSQRWRCDIAARTLNARVTRVVFTGRTADTGASEAAVMANRCRDLGVPDELIVLEEEARSTWENLLFSAPLVEQFDVIRIVSNPLHAWRARQYLARQRPDLAAKLAPAVDHQWGERPLLKAVTLVYELVVRYRERKAPRLPA